MIFRYFVRKNAPYENADFKFIASERRRWQQETAEQREHRSPQRRQRRQHSDYKHVQRQRQNTTITPQTKPMKRGNTDWRCLADASKRDQEMQRLKFTVKIIFFDVTIGSKSYTICTMHVKNIFPTDWGQPISLYTLSNNEFYSKLYLTMNQHR